MSKNKKSKNNTKNSAYLLEKNTNNVDSDKKSTKVKEVNTIKDKNIYSLLKKYIVFIVLFFLFFSFFMCFVLNYKLKKANDECTKCEEVIKVVESDNYKLIDYEGYNMKIPLDYSFTSGNGNYNITNSDKTIYIHMEKTDINYEMLIDENYQKEYIQEMQHQKNENISINHSENSTYGGKKYLLFEGSHDTYSYMIIALPFDNASLICSIDFLDNSVLNKNKQRVIDMILSYEKDV